VTTYYTNSFAAFYERYNTGWIREFAPKLADYLAQTQAADRSILDLCCGTGESASVFCEAGWQVVGLDLSPAMLDIAREKLASMIEAGKVSLVEADATDFVLPKPVGACVCLDGALNHLETLSQLERCFAAVSATLFEGGQFVFDLFEPSHFHHWHNITFIEKPDAVVVKRGVWDDNARMGMLRVSGAFDEDSTYLRVEQTLRSRTFSPSEVASALASAGLVAAECDIECTSAGMRPEALCWDAPSRRIYRALKC
jgi:SAM-dependent methyltransferase